MKPSFSFLLRLALGLILLGGSAATSPGRPSQSLTTLWQAADRQLAGAWQQVLALGFTAERA
jgi:hypothetical protein